MQTQKFTPEVEQAINAIGQIRIQEIVEELSQYDLGIALPHIHRDGIAGVLPDDRVQYESDLHVSFPEKENFFSREHTGFPVGWRWNQREGRIEACAWCHDD